MRAKEGGMPEINNFNIFFVLNLFCQGTSPVTLIYFTDFTGGKRKWKGKF